MSGNSKRIVIAFHLAGEPGRRKLRGLLRYRNEHRCNWYLQFVRSSDGFPAAMVADFPAHHIDGIAYSLPPETEGESELAKLHIPTVALDVYDERKLGSRMRNLVLINGDTGDTGRCAARHLLSQGLYKSYGFVPDTRNSTWGTNRGKAFMEEMKANGFPVARYRARRKGYDLPHLTQWIQRLPKPAAIFAAFDDRALHVLDACHEADVRVPQDVAVIGVDNDEMLCVNATPPLTSIQPDHDRAGYLAAKRLDDMMNGERLNRIERISVPTKTIVIRESTSPVSNAGRLVQRALSFIQTNASSAIKPRDVATYLKVSRSLADHRFRELQGESIGDAIFRYRLEEVRHRLIASNDTIENIAAACQFSKVSRLGLYFRKRFGCTMRDCRENGMRTMIATP